MPKLELTAAMPGGGLQRHPLRIGFESARANAVPMVVLWIVAAAAVMGYYAVPWFAGALEPIAKWQRENGSVAAFASLAFFCGVIPGVFLCTVRSLRPRRPLLTVVVLSAWCGLWGVANNWKYEFLCRWLGDGLDLGTLVMKTALDQFVWTTFVMAPVNSAFYFWMACDFSLPATRAAWPSDFVRGVFLPNLVSNWVVWIPVLCAVYAFPLPLQIQLAGLAGSYWTLMCLQIGKCSAVAGGRTGD